MEEPRGWHSRGYLPHFDVPGITQSINFHIYGSLPTSVIEKFKSELDHLKDEEKKRELLRKIDRYLDLGSEKSLLARPNHAEVVEQVLQNADGEYYRLHAWCIMANHVHVLCTPTGEMSLGEIVKGWKAVSGRQIKRLGSGIDRVWAGDYFDRYIRNEQHYWNEVAYIESNPVKAGLCREDKDWTWSSARLRAEP